MDQAAQVISGRLRAWIADADLGKPAELLRLEMLLTISAPLLETAPDPRSVELAVANVDALSDAVLAQYSEVGARVDPALLCSAGLSLIDLWLLVASITVEGAQPAGSEPTLHS